MNGQSRAHRLLQSKKRRLNRLSAMNALYTCHLNIQYGFRSFGFVVVSPN